MNLNEFNEIFELVMEYYRKNDKKQENFDIPPKKKVIYFQALEDLTAEQFRLGFIRIIQDREYTNLPSVAEIRKYALGLKEDDISARTELAKQKLKKAIQLYGAYQTIAFDDPGIHAVIDSVENNWEGICKMPLEKYEDFFEFTFTRIYKAYLRLPYQVNKSFLGIYDKTNEKENLLVIGNKQKYLNWTVEIQSTLNLLTGTNDKYNAIEVIK